MKKVQNNTLHPHASVLKLGSLLLIQEVHVGGGAYRDIPQFTLTLISTDVSIIFTYMMGVRGALCYNLNVHLMILAASTTEESVTRSKPKFKSQTVTTMFWGSRNKRNVYSPPPLHSRL